MRRLIVVCVLILAGTSVATLPVHAQPKQVLTVNPLGLLFGAYALNYESATGAGQSYVISGTYISLKVEDWTLSGLGVAGGLRLYPGGAAPRGFYYGPVLSAASMSATYSDPTDAQEYTGRGTVFSAAAILGYQWISNGGFAIDLNANLGYGFGQVTAGTYAAPVVGVVASMGLAIGYAW